MNTMTKNWTKQNIRQLMPWVKRIYSGTETYYKACLVLCGKNRRSWESNRSMLKRLVRIYKPSQKEMGAYRKFEVIRTDGRDRPGGDRAGADYFVLDLTFDEFAPFALRAYAAICQRKYPKLAKALRDKVKPLAIDKPQ